MRTRPSARILLIDEEQRILLFRFVFKQGALAGTEFWATPGGELIEGETFHAAACRELFEETGLLIDVPENHAEERAFEMVLPNGETVLAQERFYLVRLKDATIVTDYQTEDERDVMVEHKWWHIEELKTSTDRIFPLRLGDLLETLCV